MLGGHGEWFVAQYDRPGFDVTVAVTNMTPDDAVRAITAHQVVGSAAEALVALRGHGEAAATLPHAARALDLPLALRSLDPRPVYARDPDARPAVAACSSKRPTPRCARRSRSATFAPTTSTR
jgi:hypothetical protein